MKQNVESVRFRYLVQSTEFKLHLDELLEVMNRDRRWTAQIPPGRHRLEHNTLKLHMITPKETQMNGKKPTWFKSEDRPSVSAFAGWWWYWNNLFWNCSALQTNRKVNQVHPAKQGHVWKGPLRLHRIEFQGQADLLIWRIDDPPLDLSALLGWRYAETLMLWIELSSPLHFGFVESGNHFVYDILQGLVWPVGRERY